MNQPLRSQRDYGTEKKDESIKEILARASEVLGRGVKALQASLITAAPKKAPAGKAPAAKAPAAKAPAGKGKGQGGNVDPSAYQDKNKVEHSMAESKAETYEEKHPKTHFTLEELVKDTPEEQEKLKKHLEEHPEDRVSPADKAKQKTEKPATPAAPPAPPKGHFEQAVDHGNKLKDLLKEFSYAQAGGKKMPNGKDPRSKNEIANEMKAVKDSHGKVLADWDKVNKKDAFSGGKDRERIENAGLGNHPHIDKIIDDHAGDLDAQMSTTPPAPAAPAPKPAAPAPKPVPPPAPKPQVQPPVKPPVKPPVQAPIPGMETPPAAPRKKPARAVPIFHIKNKKGPDGKWYMGRPPALCGALKEKRSNHKGPKGEDLGRGWYYNPDKLTETKSKIHKLYRKKGGADAYRKAVKGLLKARGVPEKEMNDIGLLSTAKRFHLFGEKASDHLLTDLHPDTYEADLDYVKSLIKKHDLQDDEMSELANFKGTLGKPGRGRTVDKLKIDFLKNMKVTNYDSPEAFMEAKKRIQGMSTNDFAMVLAAIMNDDEDDMTRAARSENLGQELHQRMDMIMHPKKYGGQQDYDKFMAAKGA